MIPITLGALPMSMAPELMFGCITTTYYLPSGTTLLEEYFALVGKLVTKLKIQLLHIGGVNTQKICIHLGGPLNC